MSGGWRRRLVAGFVVAGVMAGAACGEGGERPALEDTPPPAASNDTPGDGAGTPPPPPPPPPPGDVSPPPPPPPVAGNPPPPPPPPTNNTGIPQTDFQEVQGSAAGWKLYGEAEGAPRDVLGASMDEGGNLWVAGGEEGLFLLKKGETTFRRYTMADGLQPYGLVPNRFGEMVAPAGEKYLKVISVTGGRAGVVYVGYQGLPNCESEAWKAPGEKEDKNVFKSGDADRVVLNDDGTLRVFHYDIYSPGHTVPGYGQREKLCTVNRIVWDKQRQTVWFAANHGMAWGEDGYEGGKGCQSEEVREANAWFYEGETRQRCNNGVMEHVHPGVELAGSDGGEESRLAGDVWGVAVRPDGDVWMGTHVRTSRFRIMTNGSLQASGAPWDFEAARKLTEEKKYAANRIDVWPKEGQVGEVESRLASERKDDLVMGLALTSDGSLWVGSAAWGLAQLDDTGKVVRRYFEQDPILRHIGAVGRDTHDESLWLGHRWGMGVSRIQGDKLVRYRGVLGAITSGHVNDVQFHGTGEERKVVLSFGASEDGTRRGGVGVFSGK